MVTHCIMGDSGLQGFAICGKTFNMTELSLLKDKTTFQILQTWIGQNTTRHHNLNVLLHTLTYIFSKFTMVWGYLQCVTYVTVNFTKDIY